MECVQTEDNESIEPVKMEEQIQNINNTDDLNELQELKSLNVWRESQEVLEQQALKELAIFTGDNQSNNLEEGEISDDNKEKPSVSNSSLILNINDYIKSQEELKKRQEHKRSMQVSERSKIAAKQISKKHNQQITSKILKRKAVDVEKEKPSKKAKLKNNNDEHDLEDNSGSEYVPSDEENESKDLERKSMSERVKNPNVEKVKDDGSLNLYKARLDDYYKSIENNQDEENEDDIELQGGLKVPAKMWNNLYSYQQDGIEWLWKTHQETSGALLGDEMGLGKTVQVIVFLAALDHSRSLSRSLKSAGLGATLIVSPATVLHQWVKHFHSWAPEFRVAVLHQSGSHTGTKTQLIKDINQNRGVLITTYSGVLKYKGILSELNWHYFILDEGHKIRNPNAKISIAVKQFRTPHRIILTGSPMQNNLQELWSIFDFVVPGVLGTMSTFHDHFVLPILQGGYSNATPMQEATALTVATTLKNIITPYLLRRSKNEVKTDINLPKKSEQVLFCSLSDEQRDLYKGYLMSEDVNSILGRGSKNWFSENHVRANVLVAITTLRKICNHPDLYLQESEPDYVNMEQNAPDFYKRSGKMKVVSALLKIWKKEKHRVLLFTQSRTMMTIFEHFLDYYAYKFLKMDGSTSISSRQPLIDKFNQDASYDVFLLTTRVGGLGINLTGADRVIIYDPDWNPATDTQARERAWRIGQSKQVTVYRLISAGTIEEKMYQRQVWKQLLSNKVLLDPKTQRFFKTSDLHDLFSLPEKTEMSNPETANIFRNSRVNLQAKIEKKKHSKRSETVTSNDTFQFSNEKIQEMKDRAQKIAKSMSSSSFEPEKPKTPYQKQLDEERELRLKERDELKKLSPLELRILNRKKLEKSADSNMNKFDDCDTSISFSNALKISEKTAKFYQDHKSGKVKSSSESSGPSSLKSASSSKEDHKHKKKHKDDMKIDTSGTLNGEIIEGLVKRETKRIEKGKHKFTVNSNESQDNYILHKLMSKKGVHTALQHETIIQSGCPESGIRIHHEAQERANLALQALRKSRLESWRW